MTAVERRSAQSLDWVQSRRHGAAVSPAARRRPRSSASAAGATCCPRSGAATARSSASRSTSVLVAAAAARTVSSPASPDDPAVTFVHDEARSYLTRTGDRFDVLQMSLIDTWAATGAGAFTLTENGLYTREALAGVPRRADADRRLQRLALVQSRRTSRSRSACSSLGVAALLDRGVTEPRQHVCCSSRAARRDADGVAVAVHRSTMARRSSGWPADEDFDLRRDAVGARGDSTGSSASPPADRSPTSTPRSPIPSSTTQPPTDERPFFFNLLKPAGSARDFVERESSRVGQPRRDGDARGALRASRPCWWLAIILLAARPIWAARPWPRRRFRAALAYFAIIGFGFMFVQIPFLQRFSVYLGHPTYTFFDRPGRR